MRRSRSVSIRKRGPSDLALGRMKAGRMNKTEMAYELELSAMKSAGLIQWYKFEGVNLRLADNTHYRPDFIVMNAEGVIEIHEVKGQWRDDAKVKIRVAADIYPFIFKAIRRKPKYQGGGWEVETF